jgi:hypothetical protein
MITRDALHQECLAIWQRQCKAHGVDPENDMLRGVLNNLLSYVLAEWYEAELEMVEYRKKEEAAVLAAEHSADYFCRMLSLAENPPSPTEDLKRPVEPLQNREKGTGRYAFDGDFDRLCTCGHRLGQHTADRGRDPETGKMMQPCIIGDDGRTHCDCACFKPAPRPQTAAKPTHRCSFCGWEGKPRRRPGYEPMCARCGMTAEALP